MLKSNGTCQKMTTLWLVPSMSYDMAPALPVKVPVNRDRNGNLINLYTFKSTSPKNMQSFYSLKRIFKNNVSK